ncbi:MAG: hypothetical protein JWM57_2298 [Phycisphaerales bacterium]|nr:hypothetical protein [Phycisphaerales bacterium]
MTAATLPATEKKLLKVLHIGVANRGVWPLEKCNASTGFASHALCDVSDAALESAREKTGLPTSAVFKDVKTAMRDGGADVAIACVPTMLHVPMAKLALDAGLPILIEKGMAPDWASAQDLANTTRQKQGKVAVAQNYRYFGVERTTWHAVNDQTSPYYLGPVHLVQYNQNRVRPEVRTLNYPFASVWDMSCHHFDNLLSWFGPMKEMTAQSWKATWSPYEHDNNTMAHIAFENGTTCQYLHTHDAARSTLDVQLHGERGALIRTGDTLTFNQRPLEQFGLRDIVDVKHVEAHGESDLLRDFYAYVVDDIEPGVSVFKNLETMAACEMMVRSITGHRTVQRSKLNV